jgi:hypothetical protein
MYCIDGSMNFSNRGVRVEDLEVERAVIFSAV